MNGEQFAHVLLFSCPNCGAPLAAACASSGRNLEIADGRWFSTRCYCGWAKDLIGVVARRHWVEPWEFANAAHPHREPCEGERIK